MKTAFITINYNTGDQLVDTLTSLFEHTTMGEDQILPDDVFVVDNASNDDSLTNAKEKFPNVNYIQTGANLGFGAAHNVLFEKFNKGEYSKYDYFALINPDLQFTDGWFQSLLDVASSSSLIAAVNPLILYSDKFNLLNFKCANSSIYINHEDYRFLANLIGDDMKEYQTREITFEGKQWTQLNSREFLALLPVDYEKLEFEIYDESLNGVDIRVGKQRFLIPTTSTFLRKLFYKAKLSGAEVKVNEISMSVDMLEFVKKNVEVINSLGASFKRENFLPDNNYFGQFPDTVPNLRHEVELFHGACVLLHAEAVRHVGGFDPDFFMYYEESDMALRMREKGYKVYAQPKSVVYHKERGSRSAKAFNFMLDSQKKFAEKWGDKIRARHRRTKVQKDLYKGHGSSRIKPKRID